MIGDIYNLTPNSGAWVAICDAEPNKGELLCWFSSEALESPIPPMGATPSMLAAIQFVVPPKQVE